MGFTNAIKSKNRINLRVNTHKDSVVRRAISTWYLFRKASSLCRCKKNDLFHLLVIREFFFCGSVPLLYASSFDTFSFSENQKFHVWLVVVCFVEASVCWWSYRGSRVLPRGCVQAYDAGREWVMTCLCLGFWQLSRLPNQYWVKSVFHTGYAASNDDLILSSCWSYATTAFL